MAQTTPARPTAFLFLVVLLLNAAQPSQSFSYFQCRNLFSVGHSLMTRVANLREARGDVVGSNRARDLAAKMELGSKVYGVVSDANELLRFLTAPQSSQSSSYFQYLNLFSLGHSLMTRVANLRAARGDVNGSNRARDVAAMMELMGSEVCGDVSDANELLRWLDELGWQRLDSERLAWVGQNYQSVFRVSNSIFRSLKVFYQSGTWREVAKTVQREVVDGELLRDYLELGVNWQETLREVVKTMQREVVDGELLRDFLELGVNWHGTLREVVKTVQREVVDGELLRDFLELGANDLRGVIQILKDLGLQYGSSTQKSHQDL